MTDPRVVHLWDAEGELGRWFFEHREKVGLGFVPGVIVWDAYLLFGPGAQWEDVPSPLQSWGYTVIGTSDRLKTDLQMLWEQAAERALVPAGQNIRF